MVDSEEKSTSSDPNSIEINIPHVSGPTARTRDHSYTAHQSVLAALPYISGFLISSGKLESVAIVSFDDFFHDFSC